MKMLANDNEEFLKIFENWYSFWHVEDVFKK